VERTVLENQRNGKGLKAWIVAVRQKSSDFSAERWAVPASLSRGNGMVGMVRKRESRISDDFSAFGGVAGVDEGMRA